MICIQYKKTSKNIAVIFAKQNTHKKCAADCGISLSFHPLSQKSAASVSQHFFFAHGCFQSAPCLTSSHGGRGVTNSLLERGFFSSFVNQNPCLFNNVTCFLLSIFRVQTNFASPLVSFCHLSQKSATSVRQIWF